jgi:hypothetical protein
MTKVTTRTTKLTEMKRRKLARIQPASAFGALSSLWYCCWLLTAFAVTLATYTFLEQQEYENFVTAVNIEIDQQKDMREAFKAFCNFFSQSAIDANATWPFYSLTNFEVLASTFMKQSGVEVMGIIQCIKDKDAAAA